MKPLDRLKAIEIIAKQNSVTVSFNVPVADHYSNVHEILIKQCNAATTAELFKEGFSLSLCEKGLSVDKY